MLQGKIFGTKWGFECLSYDGANIMKVSFAGPERNHYTIGGHIPVYKGNPILIGGALNNIVERYR